MKDDPPFVIALQELIDALRQWRENDPQFWEENKAEAKLLFRLEAAMAGYRLATIRRHD